MISNENDLATLVAEKLFVKIKDDLLTSGSSVIREELNGMKDKMEKRFDSIEETNNQQLERLDSIEETSNQQLGRLDSIEESNNQQLERLDSIEDTTASNSARIQALENDKPMKIYFSAYNDAGGEVTGQLKFPKVVSNLGNAFDGARGVFKTPVKGVYTFTFSGQQSNNIGSSSSQFIDVYVKRNGATVFAIFDDTNTDEDHYRQNINSIFSLELDENDTLQLVLSSEDRLYANSNARLIFMGQLVVAT